MTQDPMKDQDFLVALEEDIKRRQQVRGLTKKYPGPRVRPKYRNPLPLILGGLAVLIIILIVVTEIKYGF